MKKLIVTFFLGYLSLIAQETKEAPLWEFTEWEITNSNYSGNPYDIIADVRFSHSLSGEVRQTQMFYDNDNTWKFRFTGTKTGEWQFQTTSDNSTLNGLSGIVNVIKNPDSKKYGFLTHSGNKYAIQTNEDKLEGFILNVYMNQTIDEFSFRGGNYQDFIEYSREAKMNGCTAIFTDVVANSWFNFPTFGYNEGIKQNPDPKTFEQIELMISAARNEGVHVHIWAWGDEERKQTVIGNGEGINGKEDSRLQRYIAARLGPLPGWSMGYGFDLHEWVTKEEIKSWVDNLQSHLGWNHLFSGRGIKINHPLFINSYDGFGRENTDLHTTEYGPRNFNEILDDINSDTSMPHLYEERHSYLRQNFNLDMNGTRRLMWWEAMAGGFGGWFGYYNESSKAYVGYPYPNSNQLSTFYKFWVDKKRFLLDFSVDNLTNGGLTLATETRNNIILYKENTSEIESTFNDTTKFSKVIALDTKSNYNEINITEIFKNNSKWEAPYFSDWVIAIGIFDSSTIVAPVDTTDNKDTLNTNNVTITDITATQSFNNVQVTWKTVSEQNVKFYEIEKTKINEFNDWIKIKTINAKNGLVNTYTILDNISISDDLFKYRIKTIFNDNTIYYSENINHETVPELFQLNQNYPNPFNSETNIEFSLPQDIYIKLLVYNTLGELISTPIDSLVEAGFHRVKISSNNLPSGVYYYTLKAGYYSKTKKMMILK